MAVYAHKNFSYSTVATAPSPASSGTSLVVQSGDGTKFPAVPFPVTIWPVGSQPTTANAEIALVTAISTDTFTITRAQDGSSARTVLVGDQISATITSAMLTAIEVNTPVIQTITLTGSQNDVALTTGCTLLRCNNASLLTITGFSAGVDGQRLDVVSIGAGIVAFAHQNTGSSASGRLFNQAVSANTNLAAGMGTATYVYDATTARWRMVEHQQGAWITPTYSGGDFASQSGAWTVDSGDISTFKFFQKGNVLHLQWVIFTSSVTAISGYLAFAIPGGFIAAARQQGIQFLAEDGGSVWAISQVEVTGSGQTVVKLYRTLNGGTNWIITVNLTATYGFMTMEIQ